MLILINIVTIVLLIALLYGILWYIDHPWEFPLQSRARRVKLARVYLDRINQGRQNWPELPRINGRYVDSVRRRYLDV